MQLDVYLYAFEAILDQYLMNSLKSSNFNKVQSLSKTLTNFSKKTGFLDIAFYLLIHSEHSLEKSLLVLTLIKDKFKFDFENIDSQQVQTYYERLCDLATKFKYKNLPIFKQICLALTYIYLNLSSVHIIPLNLYLSPFVPKNSPPTDEQSLLYNYYFKVLQSIASEIDNSRLVLDDDSREQARRQIIEHQQNILTMLDQEANQIWESHFIHKNNVFQCFSSWIQLKYKPDILNALPMHRLMPLVFVHVLDYYGADVAAQCLRTIINMIRDGQQNAPLIQYLGFNIVQLIGPAEKYIRQKQIQDAEVYVKVILQFCSKAIYIFTDPNPQILTFLRKLVSFTKNKGFQNYDDFIDFWEDYLEQLQRISNGPIDANIQFLLQELYNAVCHQCRFPNQVISRFQHRHEDQVINQNSVASQITEHRQYTCELFELMARFLSFQYYIKFVCNKITQLNIKSQNFWSYFEVYLFSLVTPLKKLNFINQDLYLLVNTFKQLNDQPESNTPIAVKRIFLKVFRSLLNNQQKNRTLVQRIFFYSSTCFQIELLEHQAAKTFCRGCELNGKLLVDDLPSFIRMMHSYFHKENIVAGVFQIICSTQQSIQQYLLNTLLITVNNIYSLPKGSQRRDCMCSLIGVTKLIKECKLIQSNLSIVKQFLRAIFPMIKVSLQDTQSTKQDQNPQIQRTVKMLKYLMRCLGLQFWEFTPALCECVINCFIVQPICSYLYLIEILLTIFSKDKNYQQFVLDLYCQFSGFASNHLCSVSNMEKYNFLLDDLIGMNKRLLIYNAAIVIKSSQLSPLIQKCLDYVDCKIPRITKAVYTFFETIFMAYWRTQFVQKYNKQAQNDSVTIFNRSDINMYQQLKNQLKDKIHYIIAKMLQHLSQNPIEMIHNSIFDAVMAEIKAFPEWNTDIWSQLIFPLPNDIFRQKEKQEFMLHIEQTREQDFELVQRSIELLQKLLNLMSKRLAVSHKRKYDYIKE